MEVVEFRPEREQYAFTFGGVAPVRKVQPGTMLRLWTDDAYCGTIRSVDDLPSTSLTMPFVNPQTGPFYVEGAEPGDTLALHFAELTPARDYGASCTIPLFGGLTSTTGRRPCRTRCPSGPGSTRWTGPAARSGSRPGPRTCG